MSDAPKPSPSATASIAGAVAAAAPSAQMSGKSAKCPDISGHFRTSPDLDSLPDVDLSYDLDARQVRAVQLAAVGWRWARIAAEIGVDPRTLYRWRTENFNFQQALEKAKSDRLEAIDQRTHGLAESATSVLAEILENAPDHHRLRAAQIVLQSSSRLRARPKSASNDDHEPWPEPVLEPKVG